MVMQNRFKYINLLDSTTIRNFDSIKNSHEMHWAELDNEMVINCFIFLKFV